MPYTQISNPYGAFGYTTAAGMRGPLETREFINVSSASPIVRGAAVNLSSNSSQGKGVVVSTVAGNARFIGIALTSCGTGESTLLSSNATDTQRVIVAVNGGPVECLLTTAVVNGDFVTVSATTGAAGSGTSNGGFLGAFAFSTAAGALQKIAGFAHTSGSTVNEAGTTQQPRGLITIEKSFIMPSSLSTVFA